MKRLLVTLIKGYQMTLSPLLVALFGNGCRFTPTCSHYTIEAVEKHGAIKGTLLGIKRFSKCHPFGTSGYDPVPSKV